METVQELNELLEWIRANQPDYFQHTVEILRRAKRRFDRGYQWDDLEGWTD